MSEKELVPKASVPEATLPSEKNPSLEAPKGGIKVEVYKPGMIYKLAKELGKSERILSDLNFTNMRDQLIDITNTSLFSWGPRRGGDYSFDSFLHFSEDVGKRPDFGYYGPERVANLQQKLKDAGYTANFKQTPASESRVPLSKIVFSKDGQMYELNLGFDSRKAEKRHIIKELLLEIFRKPLRVGYVRKYDLPRIREGLVNENIFLEVLPRKLALDDETTASKKFDGKDEFTDFLERYADVYEDVLNIIYEEAGVQTPEGKTITLRTPVLDQDPLT